MNKNIARIGLPICMGTNPRWGSLPICNLPEGAVVKLRFRHNEFARAFVKVGSAVQEWLLVDEGDSLRLAILRGANVRQTNEQKQDADEFFKQQFKHTPPCCPICGLENTCVESE